jgi:dephospho-CoA kinase
MLKIGITGGIGSGKSMICRALQTFGIPVFYADNEMKLLYGEDAIIRRYLTQRYGMTIFADGRIQAGSLARILFADMAALSELNSMAYPALWQRYERWLQSVRSDACAMEAALLCESGFAAKMDMVVNVTAPDEVKLARVLRRNPECLPRDILRRMRCQWSDAQRASHAGFTINNDGRQAVLPQILTLINIL